MVPLARGLRTPVRLQCVSPAEPMFGSVVLDAAGRRRSPATMPGFHAGHPPRNKGLRYPADPPTVEEIVAVMRIAGDSLHGRRLRGLIVVLWRAGLRIDEALALREADLDRRRGSILVRRGQGGRRREIGMDDWGWQEREPWLIARVALPTGPLFCVINGRTRGRPWTNQRCTRRAATRRPQGGRVPTLRPSPAAPRPRGRDGPRRRPAHRHPTPTWAQQTSGSPRSSSRASTTPRSSRRSTRAARQWCRSAPRGPRCRARSTDGCGSRASASVPTPAGRAPAHSLADAAQRQSQSSSHAKAEVRGTVAHQF